MQTPLRLLLFFVLLFGLQCRKPDFEHISKSNIDSFEQIGPTSISFVATIVDLSSADHDKIGVCYSDKNTDPTIGTDNSLDLKMSQKGLPTSYSLPGLLGNTLYFLRFFIMDDGRPVYSPVKQVKTLPYPKTEIHVDSITNIWYSSVKLNGSVNCFAIPSTIVFEYGLNGNYKAIDANPKQIEGSSLNPISVQVFDLLPNTKYGFRIRVTNQAGVFYSADSSFTTKKYMPPSVVSLSPNHLGPSFASLRARVNAQDQSSNFSIEYGTTTAYGKIASVNPATATGHEDITVSADISGLTAGMTYHYRVRGENETGVSLGEDVKFEALSLVMTSPTKDTKWRAGLEQKLTYDSNFTDSLKIELYKSGALFTTIVNPVLNFGAYTWKLPTNLVYSSDYVIRVTDLKLPSFYAETPPFTITEVPSVALAAPLATDIWTEGAVQTIKWTSNYAEKVDIDLYQNNQLLQNIASGADGTGSYQWTVPKTLTAGSNYSIRIAYTATPGFYAFSPNFQIAAFPFIKISSPSQLSAFEILQSNTIQWTDNIAENVKIDLYKGGFLLETLATSAPSNGSFSWTPPNTLLPASDYSIRIVSTQKPEIFDECLPFKVIAAKYINLSQPISSTHWKANTTNDIKWDDNLDGNVKIELLNANGKLNSVAISTTPSTGSYSWLIPRSIPSGNYAIRITSLERSSLFSTSPLFTIIEADDISITYPNLGASWDAATTQTIAWTDNIASNVKIDLYKADVLVQTISTNTPSTGSFKWLVPKSISLGSDYHIRITSIENPLLFNDSPNFTIRPPFITVNQPALQDEWVRGVEQKIKWTCNIPDPVKVDLYKAGAFVSTIVAQTTQNDGLAFIPMDNLVFDADYFIRITSTADPSLHGDSKLFSITKPVPTVTNLSANHIVQNSATLNGTVNANNFDTKIVFEYGLSINYDQSMDAVPNTSTGSSSTNVHLDISNLQSNTEYHYRIKASSSMGISYSPDMSFKTIADDQVVDADYNVYNTVLIGSQRWIKENLRTTHFSDGSAVEKGLDSKDYSRETSPSYFFNYMDNEANAKEFGRLYTWFVVSDSRNVCPLGWHIPTSADVDQLTSTLGGALIAGGKLKETGTDHWANPNEGADNSSNFTAISSGYHDSGGGTYGQSMYTYFWSSSSTDFTNASTIGLIYNDAKLHIDPYNKSYGFSVRCLKN